MRSDGSTGGFIGIEVATDGLKAENERAMKGSASRSFLAAATCVLVLGAQILLLEVMLRRVNLVFPVVIWLLLAFLAIAPLLVVGILSWTLYNRIHGDASYLRSLVSVRWVGLSFLLVTSQVMTTYFYAVLKLSIPLLNPRNFDQILWDFDRILLLGYSPNVFFLNLFSIDWFLRLIDFGYGNLFFVSITAAAPFFFAHPRDSVRVGYFANTVILWTSGAWLYWAVPSLGPAYKFFGVWDEVRSSFPVTTFLQHQLFENYEKVLLIPYGVLSPDIDPVFGIAAFPSMHVAFHVNLALWLASWSRIWGRIGYVMAAIVFVGSVLTGWHYLIDSIAGAVLGVVVYMIARPIMRWVGPAVAGDSAGLTENLPPSE